MLQVLKHNTRKDLYCCYKRWGRVGYDGQKSQDDYSTLEDAIADYNAKKHEKAGRGKYKVIDIVHGDDDDDDDGEMEDEEEERKTSKKSKKAPKKVTKKSKKRDDSEDEDEDDEEETKTSKKKKKKSGGGSVPVDEHFPNDDCEVLTHNGTTYACTLNQTNLAKNSNKFYII